MITMIKIWALWWLWDNKSQKKTKFEDFITIKEFQDMFLDELSTFPPYREMKLSIDLAPETKPVTKALYKMAPVKMRKLAKQMQEMLEEEAIRPSVSHKVHRY